MTLVSHPALHSAKEVYNSLVVQLNSPFSSWCLSSHLWVPEAHFLWNILTTLFAFHFNLSIISTPHLLSQGYNIVYPYIYLSAFCPEMTLKSLERHNDNKTYCKKKRRRTEPSLDESSHYSSGKSFEQIEKKEEWKPKVVTERSKLPDKNLRRFGTCRIREEWLIEATK